MNGFTLIEVLVSMVILAIGLVSIAALIAGTLKAGTRSRYLSMASILASEKLDSLNRWPSADESDSTLTAENSAPTDENIWPGGALTGPATCATGDDYCDEVTVSEASGADYETETQDVGGVATTTTVVHTNAGCVGTPAACGVPTPTGGDTFTRRWLITANPTITSASGATATATGARRITVIVTLDSSFGGAPLQFQMSMVRP